MKQLHKEKKAVYLILPTGGQMPEAGGFVGHQQYRAINPQMKGFFK